MMRRATKSLEEVYLVGAQPIHGEATPRYDFFFFRGGTFPRLRRASERPIAIACLRLFTFLPERPDLSFPRFISCIARLTFCDDLRPYFFLDDDLGA